MSKDTVGDRKVVMFSVPFCLSGNKFVSVC